LAANTTNFCGVHDNGPANNGNASDTGGGVSPCFAIS
jgi:hypothetical protein